MDYKINTFVSIDGNIKRIFGILEDFSGHGGNNFILIEGTGFSDGIGVKDVYCHIGQILSDNIDDNTIYTWRAVGPNPMHYNNEVIITIESTVLEAIYGIEE